MRAPPPKKRTPRSSSPSVTPVAAKTSSRPGPGHRCHTPDPRRRRPRPSPPALPLLVRAPRERAWISPPRHLSAAAASTPSGAPPSPSRRGCRSPRRGAMPAVRSPSLMSWMRAPAARTSSISSACRGRSRITTRCRRRRVQGLGDRPTVLRRRVQAHLARPRAHDELLHVGVRRVQEAALLAAASTTMAFGEPVAQRLVPSSGSTAMSTRAGARDAHLLADVEHGRLVPLALADDDGAVHADGLHGLAHGLHRRVIGRHTGRRAP